MISGAAPALADSPYGGPRPAGTDPYAYQDYMRITAAQYPPKNLGGDSWKYSSKSACDLYGFGDPHCTPQTKTNESDPQELHGVTGASVDKAWEHTTGRPDVVIANTDSGIMWDDRNSMEALNNKIYLNAGELPEPNWGVRNPAHPYDRNGDGVFDIRDYCPDWHDVATCGGQGDSRVIGHDVNGNGIIDAEDLIFLFSTGQDKDHDGYVDNIAGWNFYSQTNDPFDSYHYGHGTGEAKDSTGEANTGPEVGTCPDCRIMPIRVGDSFIADVNSFAQGVVFATDTGASMVQSALGTLNNSRFAQQAVDYAYRHGVALIASAADESAAHHNQPSALEHASVMNAIGEPQTDTAGPPGNTGSASGSYLQVRGCTNVGAYITASVPANSCSSEAVGRSAGMAGLAYAAARNAVAQHKIADYGTLDGPGGVPAGFGLSAEEIHQLIATTADDINNVTPIDKRGQVDFPSSKRYAGTAGWDPFFGYGRINANRIVSAVEANAIPPEAYIDSPKWYGTVPTTAPISVVGTVAALRAASYSVQLQWAPWSWRDTVSEPAYTSDGVTMKISGGTSPQHGVVATIDPAKVKAALDMADTSAPGLGKGTVGPAVDPATGRGDHENRQIPDKFGVILRMVVTAKDASGAALKNLDGKDLAGIATKDINVHDDPALLKGFPIDLQGDGAAAPRFADLNDDGKDELVVATSNGLVHAYQNDGSELPGWPVHTTPLPGLNTASAAFTSGQIPTPIYSATLRSPAIGDLFRDGHLEVVVPDFAGRITAFDRFGNVVPGFPVRNNPAYSAPQPDDRAAGFYRNHPELVPGDYPVKGAPLPNDPDLVPSLVNRPDKANRQHWWFLSAPTLADIDPAYPGLEIIAPSADRHVYAWHADGTPVKGWPVMLRDPATTASVNPYTHAITQKAGIDVLNGAKIVTSAAVADINGDGKLEVAVAPNEQYKETANTDDNVLSNPAISKVVSGGNDRLYAIYADGAAHGAGPGTPANGFPNANAFLPGWPAKIPTLSLELLPVVGDGPTGSPVIGDLDGTGKLQIAEFGTAGPVAVLNSDASSYYDKDPTTGNYRTLQTAGVGPASNSKDAPSIPAAGGLALTDLAGTGKLQIAAPAVGLGKLVDLILPDDQVLSDNHLAVYDPTRNGARGQLPAFPREVNDLQFLSTPASADVDGSGKESVLVSSAYSDLHAFNSLGQEPGLPTLDPTGWPKFTGGWSVVAPAVGDINGDGKRVVASATREGSLFVWSTTAGACAPASWPEWGHDGWNTNLAGFDSVRPARVSDLAATSSPTGATLTWTAVGNDGRCGTAQSYDVRVADQPITDASFAAASQVAVGTPKPAGGKEAFSVGLPADAKYVAVRVYDADPAKATPAHPANLSALATAPIAGLAPTPGPAGTASPAGQPSPSAPETAQDGRGLFTSMTPTRILDTRLTSSPIAAGQDRTLQVAPGAAAVALNVTVTRPSAALDLEVYPTGDRPQRRTSNLNVVRNQTRANMVVVPVGRDGTVSFSVSAGSADVVVDELGSYAPTGSADAGEAYRAVTPARILDTRTAQNPVRAGADRSLPVLGRGGIPSSDVSSVAVLVTALGTRADADLQVYPTGRAPSQRTSTLNLTRNATVSNLAIVPVGADGSISLSASQNSIQVVVDVVGWFRNDGATTSNGRLTPLTPARIYDSRSSGGLLPAGEERPVQVAGLGGVPSSARVVFLTMTSTGATTGADLQAYPSGDKPSPRTSDLNVVRGQTAAVLVAARLGGDGKLVLSSSAGRMHVILDVVGWSS
ncbi:MAG: hypothetical protein NVSMB55_13040 [Mycobacteriales bacterium]